MAINSHAKSTARVLTSFTLLLLAVRTSTVATASKKVTMITSTHNLPLKFYIYVTEKRYSSTDNLLRAFGTHSDPFISDDVCCYSQPRFDETAKLFHK